VKEKRWEKEETRDGHSHARNVLTLSGEGVRAERHWSGSLLVEEVGLEEFLAGCVHDRIAERFGRERLDEAIAEAKRLSGKGPQKKALRLMSPDRTVEIQHEMEPGPRDDFYGVAEHCWRVLHRPSGKVILKFEGGDYGNRWTGTRDVQFSEGGRALIATTEKGAEKIELP